MAVDIGIQMKQNKLTKAFRMILKIILKTF